jgi:hypothetical protein
MAALARAEEVLVPFTGGMPRDRVPVTTKFRSTWLSSSLKALRERNHFERYLSCLPPEHRDTVSGLVVGQWLPVEVAVAHYDACDRLELSEEEMVAIGAEVGKRAQGAVLSVGVNLAKGAGVTPWTIITRYPAIWDRTWVGGGVSIIKSGPKDARLEVAGWRCAHSKYCRVAFRGVLQGLAALFSTNAFVKDAPRLCTKLTLGYVMQWA